MPCSCCSATALLLLFFKRAEGMWGYEGAMLLMLLRRGIKMKVFKENSGLLEWSYVLMAKGEVMLLLQINRAPTKSTGIGTGVFT